jgi:hypothetical protein
MSPASGYACTSRGSKLLVWCPHDEWGANNQLRGTEIGGGPRPVGFFGRSVPT